MAEVKTYNREFSRVASRTVVTGMSRAVGGLPKIDIRMGSQCSQGVAVFQKANPFPRSIFDNVALGLRINGMTR